MHRSTDSWVTTFSLLPQPSHSWGHFLPELRSAMGRLPGFPVQKLAAAQDGAAEKASQLLRSFNALTGASKPEAYPELHCVDLPHFHTHLLMLVNSRLGLMAMLLQRSQPTYVACPGVNGERALTPSEP